MDTLPEVLARNRDLDGVAFEAPGRQTPTSHSEFATNAWKAGNLLRHYGVRPGSRVALVIGPNEPTAGTDAGNLGLTPEPLIGLLGAGAAGATVDVAPEPPIDARALLVPERWIEQYPVEPGTSVIAYGGIPDQPGVAQFERERWSENPTEPPGTVATDDPFVRVGGREYSHGELLEAARGVIREYDLDDSDTVAVEGSLTGAGAIVAGILAPLVSGATIRSGPGDGASSESEVVYAVSGETDSEDTPGGSDDPGAGLDPSSLIG